MAVDPASVTWETLGGAAKTIATARAKLSATDCGVDDEALHKFLCGYFGSDAACTKKQGKTISPVGFKTGKGGKCLKVRWAYPGCGKSGGLRLAVVAYCDSKRVRIAGAWIRNDDPSDEEFAQAFKEG